MHRSSRTHAVITILVLSAAASLRAQVPPPAPAAPPPAAAPAAPTPADQQIVLLQRHIALQEEKVRAITADMIAIDRQVEREVENMITRLTVLTDSTDSDRKIATEKREIIEALKNSIDFYRKLRDERKSQLLHPTYSGVSEDDLQQDIAKLDERVEERVDQIMQVTASLAQDTDYDKYERYTTDENGRRLGVDDRVQQAERHNQRNVNTKVAVEEGLLADKARLEAETARLEQQLARTQDADTMAYLQDAIAWNRELILRRDDQAAAALSPAPTSGKQPVTRKAANELSDLFDEQRLDIKADYRKLVALKSRRDQERARLKLLTDKLTHASAATNAPAP